MERVVDKNKKHYEHHHPNHTMHLKKLNRIIGQLQGVQKMISEQRYCPEILTQTRAASAALKAVELDVLETHLEHCVTVTLQAKKETEAKHRIHELIQLLDRF